MEAFFKFVFALWQDLHERHLLALNGSRKLRFTDEVVINVFLSAGTEKKQKENFHTYMYHSTLWSVYEAPLPQVVTFWGL